MTSGGSAHVGFRRALEISNELLVPPRGNCRASPSTTRCASTSYSETGDPYRYQRAAVRCLGRFVLEARDVTIEGPIGPFGAHSRAHPSARWLRRRAWTTPSLS